MKISELSTGDRPRERMIDKGAEALSNSELLAILIRHGGRGTSAIEMAQTIIAESGGSLTCLFDTSLDKLCSIPGVGPGKACSIAAALELGKRLMQESSSVVKRPVSTARMAFDIIYPSLKGLSCEECWVMFFNNHNYLISKSRLSSGGADSTVIDARKILKMALDKNSTGIILVHNHPSGSPKPSLEDIKQTDALHTALTACGINLLDHIIICDDCFYSFSEEKVRMAY